MTKSLQIPCIHIYFRYIFILSLCLVLQTSWAQDKTQTIRGQVIDKTSMFPLPGASVTLVDSDPLIGTTTDMDGNFVLEQVPVGRQTLKVEYLGYIPYSTENLIVNSAKEVYISIAIEENIVSTGEVVVTATGENGSNRPINDLSVVSTRSFSVEETQRYAASINDPGRMAMAFPGVQSNDDNENDIMIRGNAAAGVLWRLEGLDIPNPNHYARPGTSGGGITVFSASLLSNSDFSTGAFAAEYSNAFSGVFDMRFRKGNMNNREYTFRAGLVGVDFATEGPIKKGKSSYLVNYRYSTLGILSAFGLYVVRENVANTFQDLSFNLAFNSKDNKNIFTVFGVGGLNDEQWFVKDSSEWVTELDYVRRFNPGGMGVIGATYTRLLDEKSVLKVVGGLSYSFMTDNHNNAILDSIRTETNEFKDGQYSLVSSYTRKLNSRLKLKAGFIGHGIFYNLRYQAYLGDSIGLYTFLDDQGMTFLLQTYAQLGYRLNEKITVNAGAHFMFLTLNNTVGIDPRVSMRFQLAKKTTLTAAYGLHSKTLPMGTYLLRIQDDQGNISTPNLSLKMPKSHHFIVGLEQLIGQGTRIQLEAYYQRLLHIPVSTDTSNTFWFYNMRDHFGQIAMQSAGTGQNMGIDLTVEKFFGKGFFILCTGSIFQSKFTAANGKTYNTRMNNSYASSLMGGKEFTFGVGNTIQIGAKAFIKRGLRYSPVDAAASAAAGVFIPDESNPFSLDYGFYYRIDTKISYRKDAKKFAYTIALDIQNTTDALNIEEELYDRQLNQLIFDYQSSILPVLSFQLDF